MNKIRKWICCCYTCVEIQEQIIDTNECAVPLLHTHKDKRIVFNEKDLSGKYEDFDFLYTNKHFSPGKNLSPKKYRKKYKRTRRDFSYYKNIRL